MPRTTIAMLMLALIAVAPSACAPSPDTIQPAVIPASTYDGYSCSQLRGLKDRIALELESAVSRQQSAATNDIWGVVLIGLPVASMGGGNQAPQIASLKGQRATVSGLLAQRNCT